MKREGWYIIVTNLYPFLQFSWCCNRYRLIKMYFLKYILEGVLVLSTTVSSTNKTDCHDMLSRLAYQTYNIFPNFQSL